MNQYDAMPEAVKNAPHIRNDRTSQYHELREWFLKGKQPNLGFTSYLDERSTTWFVRETPEVNRGASSGNDRERAGMRNQSVDDDVQSTSSQARSWEFVAPPHRETATQEDTDSPRWESWQIPGPW